MPVHGKRVRTFILLLASCCIFFTLVEISIPLFTRKISWRVSPTDTATRDEGGGKAAMEHTDTIRSLPADLDMYQYDTDIDLNSTVERVSVARSKECVSMVTLFTTLKDVASRDEIHQRTLKNWAALSPGVQPLLYVPSPSAGTDRSTGLDSSGWWRRNISRLNHGIPILKYMFMDALEHSQTPFVGFANADILFDESLEKTLRHVYDVIDMKNTMVLITGRRRNANISATGFGDGSNLPSVVKVARRLPLFRQDAQDYFFISKRGLEWAEIPDLVIGRIGFDNWLVAKALQWNITVIDASYSLLALHQLGADGKFAGLNSNPEQVNLNIDMLPNFNFSTGVTGCAPLMVVCGGPAEEPIIAHHRTLSDTGEASAAQTHCHPRLVHRKQFLHRCKFADNGM